MWSLDAVKWDSVSRKSSQQIHVTGGRIKNPVLTTPWDLKHLKGPAKDNQLRVFIEIQLCVDVLGCS